MGPARLVRPLPPGAGDGLPTPLLAHTAPGAACISSSQPLLPECCDEPFNSNPNTDG